MVKILKTARTQGPSDDLSSFNVLDLQEQADQTLANANAEAAAILANAEREAEELRLSAERQGLAHAMEQFEERVESRATELSEMQGASLRTACESVLETLQTTTCEWLAEWKRTTVSLAKGMAEKVLDSEISLDRERILMAWINRAVLHAAEARDLRLEVNPDDAELATVLLNTLSETQPIFDSIPVVPTEEVEIGGCRIRSHSGTVDCQLSSQLDRLEQQLTS
ncbi:MAG: FliH/SctL family protein [Aureliella sp.]